MGHLFMPGQEWIYDQWQPIQPRHELTDMAFELFTVPEPSSWGLATLVLAAAGAMGRRRHR